MSRGEGTAASDLVEFEWLSRLVMAVRPTPCAHHFSYWPAVVRHPRRGIEPPSAQKQLGRQRQAAEEDRKRQCRPAPLASPGSPSVGCFHIFIIGRSGHAFTIPLGRQIR